MTTVDELMTYDTFVKDVHEIKLLSDELCDGWMICKKTGNDDADFYATKKVQRVYEQSEIAETVTFEYHLAYSTSYAVPLLCFNSYKADGSLLTLEENWKILDVERLPEKYSLFTQMDHPVLQKPFLTVHPCKTSEFINNCFQKSKNMTVSWLSAIGPITGLEILPQYAKLTV